MEKLIRRLRTEFCLAFVWAGVLAALFEWDVCPTGWAAGNGLAEYYANLAGIAMVVILVPMSLKLMAFRWVKASFSQGSLQQAAARYKRWSEVRLAMLAVAGWANIVAYYLTLDSTGGICAAIVAIASCFCWPSCDKLAYETGREFPQVGLENGNKGGA